MMIMIKMKMKLIMLLALQSRTHFGTPYAHTYQCRSSNNPAIDPIATHQLFFNCNCKISTNQCTCMHEFMSASFHSIILASPTNQNHRNRIDWKEKQTYVFVRLNQRMSKSVLQFVDCMETYTHRHVNASNRLSYMCGCSVQLNGANACACDCVCVCNTHEYVSCE